MDEEVIKEILWIAGLKNAVEFGGKPNKKAVMGKLMAQRADLRSQAKIIMPLLDQIILEIGSMNSDTQQKKLLELDPTALDKEEKIEEEKELPDLPNADQYDKIVMRLAPYPSGALHIGNARMVVLNNEYIQKYKGSLYLFYDDTIGSPAALRHTPQAKYVLPEAYDLIKEGLDWLGVKIDKIYYKSDRLEIYYEYCEKLIKEEMAYVCSCSAKDFRTLYKDKKKDCPHRNKSVEQNLDQWQEDGGSSRHRGPVGRRPHPRRSLTPLLGKAESVGRASSLEPSRQDAMGSPRRDRGAMPPSARISRLDPTSRWLQIPLKPETCGAPLCGSRDRRAARGTVNVLLLEILA